MRYLNSKTRKRTDEPFGALDPAIRHMNDDVLSRIGSLEYEIAADGM